MLDEILKVKIANEKKELYECVLELYDEQLDDNVKLVLKNREQIIAFSADNYFDALKKLRRYLEDRNKKILCKGSNENVYPSAMQLNAGSGRNAYSLVLGKQAKFADVVDIFEESDFDSCTSCNKQKDFFERWTESLNK
jgi:lysyl-tRNA synthetase class I